MKLSTLLIFILTLLIISCSDHTKTEKIPPNTTPCTVKRVIDGDTFHCTLSNGEDVKVRLIGVDTPESTENPKAKRDAERSGRSLEEIVEMGKIAKEFTKELLPKGETVYLEFDVQKTDKNGRYLAYVWLPDGRMLNEVLLKEGYAQVYTIPPNVKYQERFLQAQRYARENKKGLWGMGGF
ncbi:MAG: thermonuclease family protein [Aquificaceae bacterium]